MVNRPEVVDEVTAAFEAYERALLANDVEAMNEVFWDDPRTVRFGIAEIQYGADTIAAWRRTASPVPTSRRVGPVTVTSFGADVAVVDCEFSDDEQRGRGRQSQTWVRFADGWHIVSAHVSLIDAPPDTAP